MNTLKALHSRLADISTGLFVAREAAKALVEMPADDVPLSPVQAGRLLIEIDGIGDQLDWIGKQLVEAATEPQTAA